MSQSCFHQVVRSSKFDFSAWRNKNKVLFEGWNNILLLDILDTANLDLLSSLQLCSDDFCGCRFWPAAPMMHRLMPLDNTWSVTFSGIFKSHEPLSLKSLTKHVTVLFLTDEKAASMLFLWYPLFQVHQRVHFPFWNHTFRQNNYNHSYHTWWSIDIWMQMIVQCRISCNGQSSKKPAGNNKTTSFFLTFNANCDAAASNSRSLISLKVLAIL